MTTAQKLKVAERVAKRFHYHYEKQAPDYGYKTRKATAVPWSKLPKSNKQLMISSVFRTLLDTDML